MNDKEEQEEEQEEEYTYWGCVTCGEEYPEDAGWCRRCQTYKNFGWIGGDE